MTHYTVEIDERSLEQTARVLKTINPGRSSADHMRRLARDNMCDGSTTLSTAGWQASGYFTDSKPGVMVVIFSVSAYSVELYLNKQGV